MLQEFDAHVARRPAAPALVADGAELTYARLDRESRGHAERLRAVPVGPESVVAVVADRGVRYVAMVLGVLRSGAAFLPVEASVPVRRARQMLATAGARVALAEPGLADHAGRLGPDLLVAEPTPGHADGAVAPRHPAGLAYVIFTSGSTGQPKGAMIVDRGMDNHLAAKIADLGLGTDDVVGFTAPLSFDISVWQMLAPLAVGARVAVASAATVSEPRQLVTWLGRHAVTVLEIVPSFLTLVVEELARDPAARAALRPLRYLVATGEALSAELVRRWYGLFTDIPVVNAYGPTECSDDVTHHVVTPAEAAAGRWSAIGREIRHTQLYVVDADGRERPTGTEGELMVGGRGVGRGYIDDPVRTALAFPPDHLSGRPGRRLYRTGDRVAYRPDGALSYLGRLDRQVKVRGHRVEPGDVEAALLALADVTAAACVLREDRLEAFVTVRTGRNRDGRELLDLLRASVPPYLLPRSVTVLDRLPTGRSGKVDLAALATDAESAAKPAADTALEAMCALVATTLGAAEVGPDDDFFALGGDSLAAMKVVARARRRFDAENAPMAGFLADPTARGLLTVIEKARTEPAAPRAGIASGVLSSGQERLWFMERLHPRHGAQLIRLAFTLRGTLDTAALQHALDAVVARHEPLRTVFSQERGLPASRVHPTARLVPRRCATAEEAEAVLAGDDGPTVDSAEPPLACACLAPTGVGEHRLVLALHHMIADGWSLAVLCDEIATFYQRHRAGDRDIPGLDHGYSRYVAEERDWLSGPDGADCVAYWMRQLDGAPTGTDLPLDRPAPARPDFTARSVVARLSAADTAAVADLARAHRATPFMVVLATLAAVLRELTGRDDMVVGIDSVNRSWAGSETLIGTFVNQLPLRLDAGGAADFGHLLDAVRDRCVAAYENDRLPFHQIVAAANPPRRSGRFPLFQVKLTHQSGWRRPLALPDLTIEPVDLAEPVTELDLMLDMSGEDDQLRLELLYRAEVLDRSTVDCWLDRILQRLRTGIGGAGRRTAGDR
jgi:mycobactin peptide synthetase MbtE